MLTLATIPLPAVGKPARDLTLTDDLLCEQWIIPVGTTVRVWQTKVAGYVILAENTQDKRGFTIPRRIFFY